MALETRHVDYSDQGVPLQGYLAYDASKKEKRPAVLVAHQWGGRDEFVGGRAEALAKAGYVGFALDMFGKGVRGSNPDENYKLIEPFLQDRSKVAPRMAKAVEADRGLDVVDGSRIAAIGYCFGGLCVLDLARSGGDVRGVVSLHGILSAPPQPSTAKIGAHVLALHGAEDPMVPIEQVAAFKSEMTGRGAEWQLHMYGHAQHAFAVPGANNAQLGLKHDNNAERRSWQSLMEFLREVFA
jgi:dienelactone hydrolase